MSKMFCCLQVKPLGLLKPSSLVKVSGRFKAHQDSLPRLPVPALQQSLDRYLKALQPIVSEEEWTQTKQLVEEFQTAGGVGERLQKGLERRARKMENWVSGLPRSHRGPGRKGGGGHRALSEAYESTLAAARLSLASHRIFQYLRLGGIRVRPAVSSVLALCLALGRALSEQEHSPWSLGADINVGWGSR